MALGSLGSVSVTGFPVESTARQSGKKMRTTNVALSPHCVGGVGDQLPPWHLHSTFLPCTVTIFSADALGVEPRELMKREE